MARKISFVNYKGGVGKTSIAVNIAGCLAGQGKRVLLIDCDPQSNSSIWLLRLERWNHLNKQPNLSLLSIFAENGSTLDSIRIHDVVETLDGDKALHGLDLVPTTFNLMDLEHEFQEDPEHPFFIHFYEQLKEIEDEYDYILFDCPPNAFRTTQCALFSSDEIYVPSNPDALSLIGLSLITEKIFLFNQSTEDFRTRYASQPCQVAGVILNSIKLNINIEVPKQRMRMRLDHFIQQGKVAPYAHIFPRPVRDAVMVRRAVIMGFPLEILDRVEGIEKVRDDYRAVTRIIENIHLETTATVTT